MNTKIHEIIDIPANQKLLTSFSDAVGIPTAIVDLEGNILIGCRWQRICTDFHRMNQRATEKCTESDTTLANNLKKGQKYSLVSLPQRTRRCGFTHCGAWHPYRECLCRAISDPSPR